ncbi:MAG: beta-galactosidase trimerization domain-containing protein, partial [Lachnospiraceae bacterium]|nr:beta-galactosidase trimerization domain-containing protein [Lachnospiraceae bacterium]
FRELKTIGNELDRLGDTLLGSRTKSEVALIFDYDNCWASELCCGPSSDPEYKDYGREVMRYYQALNDLNVSTDVLWEEADFSGYKVVVAPILYMVKPGFKEKIDAFVKNGGTFVASAFSGIADETDLVYLGGQPGPLRDVLGIFVEEIDCLPPDRKNSFIYGGVRYEAKQYFDVITKQDAACGTLASYESDFYAGCPAVTKNTFGSGHAYYVATRSCDDFYRAFLKDVITEAGVGQLYPEENGLEVTERVNENGTFRFFLNHTDAPRCVSAPSDSTDILTGRNYEKGGSIELKPYGVVILKLQ